MTACGNSGGCAWDQVSLGSLGPGAATDPRGDLFEHTYLSETCTFPRRVGARISPKAQGSFPTQLNRPTKNFKFRKANICEMPVGRATSVSHHWPLISGLWFEVHLSSKRVEFSQNNTQSGKQWEISGGLTFQEKSVNKEMWRKWRLRCLLISRRLKWHNFH